MAVTPFPVLLGTFFPHRATQVELPPEEPSNRIIMSEEVTDMNEIDDSGDDDKSTKLETATGSKCDDRCEMCEDTKHYIDLSLTLSILVGDFFRNLLAKSSVGL